MCVRSFCALYSVVIQDTSQIILSRQYFPPSSTYLTEYETAEDRNPD